MCVCGMTRGCRLTLLGHADLQTHLQPAVLAAVPGHLVDHTALLPMTRVHHVLLDASPEEPLTATHTHTVRTALLLTRSQRVCVSCVCVPPGLIG